MRHQDIDDRAGLTPDFAEPFLTPGRPELFDTGDEDEPTPQLQETE